MIKSIHDTRDSNVYYLHYLDNLYTMIKSGIFDYSWEYIEDITIEGEDSTTWYIAGNPFIQQNKEKKIGLAEDILVRGMYAPFISSRQGLDESGKMIYNVASGKHRIHALKLLSQQKPLGKRFLFVNFERYAKEEYETPLRLYMFEGEKLPQLIVKEVRTLSETKSLIDHFICYMNDYFFKESIDPSPIINNEELFENFIRTGTIL